jgi:hypothetical protein
MAQDSIRHVPFNGTFVVSNAAVVASALPGRLVRADLR